MMSYSRFRQLMETPGPKDLIGLGREESPTFESGPGNPFEVMTCPETNEPIP